MDAYPSLFQAERTFFVSVNDRPIRRTPLLPSPPPVLPCGDICAFLHNKDIVELYVQFLSTTFITNYDEKYLVLKIIMQCILLHVKYGRKITQ